MEFSRPEYWNGEPFPSPGDLPNSGIEPGSPAFPADSLPTALSGKPQRQGKDQAIALEGWTENPALFSSMEKASRQRKLWWKSTRF